MATLDEQQEYNNGTQSNASTGGGTPASSRFNNISAPMSSEKTSPARLAEDLGRGKKAGCVLYIQNRSNGKVIAKTNKFYMQQFAIGLKERSQILETFGTANVSFFGSSVKVYNFGGTALDWGSQGGRVYEFFHASSLLQLYENALKGSELVKNNRIAVIRLMNHTIFGYPLALNVQYDQGNDKLATFSLGFLVTKHMLTLPGLVTETELSSLYDPTRVKELSPEAEILVSNIDLVSTACKICLETQDGDYHNPDNPSILALSLSQVKDLHTQGKFEPNLKNLCDTLKEFLEAGDGQVSPFIAANFGGEATEVEAYIDTIIFELDTLKEQNNYKRLEAYRQKLTKIQDFMDSLLSLKAALTV